MTDSARFYILRNPKLSSREGLQDDIVSLAPASFIYQWKSPSTTINFVFFGYDTDFETRQVYSTISHHISTKEDFGPIQFDINCKPEDEIFLFSLPDAVNHSTSILSLVHAFDEEATLKHPPGLFVVTPSSDTKSIILQHFLPRINFGHNSSMKMVAGDSYDVPYLLIQNLPEDVSKKELIECFTGYGFEPEFIETIPNHQLKNVTAEVIFPSNEIATAFTNKMNFGVFGTNTIIIRHYLSPKRIEEMKQWKIKITGIKKNTTLQDVARIFSQYGEVFSVSIRDSTGVVEFKDEESAKRAVDKPPAGFKAIFMTVENSKMIVLNFPIGTREEDIRAIFPAAVEVKILPPKYNGVRPVAHVTFGNKGDMKDAIDRGNQMTAEGMRLICMRFKEFHDSIGALQKSMNATNAIFVVNIPKHWSMEDVVRCLHQFGDILYVKFSAGNSTRAGFAGVLYADQESIGKALEKKIRSVTIKRYTGKQ